jgi:prepilin-type N-terminal cleavage/methylation domain-containing protein
MLKKNGFTLFEIMVGLAIVGILAAIGLPNLSNFTTKLRVDNEISDLNRLILTARNTAINSGQNVTICPLSSSLVCTSNWQNKISVFIDDNINKTYETAVNERLIKVKSSITTNDKLQFAADSLTFTPDGRLLANGGNTFKYCPKGHTDLSRGIIVSSSGRSYKTSDTDNDGKDEDRSNNEITCS